MVTSRYNSDVWEYFNMLDLPNNEPEAHFFLLKESCSSCGRASWTVHEEREQHEQPQNSEPGKSKVPFWSFPVGNVLEDR